MSVGADALELVVRVVEQVLYEADVTVAVADQDDTLVDSVLVIEDVVLWQDGEVEAGNLEVEIIPLVAGDGGVSNSFVSDSSHKWFHCLRKCGKVRLFRNSNSAI